jgi:hypothetical protein
MHTIRRRGEFSKLGLAFAGEAHQRRPLVIRIRNILGYAVRDQNIDDALHTLTGVSQASGNLGHGFIASGSGAQDLPAGLGLSDLPGNGISKLAKGAGELEYIRDDAVIRDDLYSGAVHMGCGRRLLRDLRIAWSGVAHAGPSGLGKRV